MSLFYSALPILLWQLLAMSTIYGKPPQKNNPLFNQIEPIRVAIMPFCDESSEIGLNKNLDRQKMYNYSISKLKGLHSCKQEVEWVSKNRTGKMITSYISKIDNENEITSSCNYSVTNSVCEEINADIIILGEYIINKDKSIEVYYSYENCEGIYSSDIPYLTDQPIIGNAADLTDLYSRVGSAIQQDLQQFLECKTGQTKAEANGSLEEARALFSLGDESAVNYLKSIELLEKVATSQMVTPEVQYHLGMAYFAIAEYQKAETYFKEAPNYEHAEEFMTYCALESRPAIWYNNEKRRRDWWNGLHNQWQLALNTQVLGLKNNAIPTDEQINSLFELTSIKIENILLPDLSGVEALTNLIQLSCEKTNLFSLEGIEKLNKLGQLSINNNKITHLEGISQIPGLTRIYCRNNPMNNLQEIEKMNSNRLVIFCGGSVPGKEMRRIRTLGFKVQP